MTNINNSQVHLDDGTDAIELYWGIGSRIAVRLTAEHTGGLIGVTHFSAVDGETVPLHLHTREDEVFLVASGSVELTADGITRTITAGGVAFLPRGSAHSYTVTTTGSEFFVVTIPGGFEKFFTAAGIALTDRNMQDLAKEWTRERANQIEENLDIGLRWLNTENIPEET